MSVGFKGGISKEILGVISDEILAEAFKRSLAAISEENFRRISNGDIVRGFSKN